MRRFTNEPERVLNFLPNLNTGQVIDIVTKALGAALPAHRSFQENATLTGKKESSATHDLKSVSDSSSGVLVACQPRAVLHGSNVQPEDAAADSIIEMSSFSSSLDSSAMSSDTSRNLQRFSKIDLASRRLAAFSHPKSDKSHLKDSSIPAMVAEGTELLEVVISGGSSDTAAGIGQEQLQQHRRIADSIHAEQWHAGAAGDDGTSIETEHSCGSVLELCPHPVCHKRFSYETQCPFNWAHCHAHFQHQRWSPRRST